MVKLLFVMMASYLVTDFLYLYCYGNLLGCRYSKKVTIIATAATWATDCVVKLIPQVCFEVVDVGVLNIFPLLFIIGYLLVFFRGSLGRRILIGISYMLMTVFMDSLGMSITMAITGSGFELFLEDVRFTCVANGCSACLITLGTILFVWFFRLLELNETGLTRGQWGWCLLPVSQYFMIQKVATWIYHNHEGIPWLFVLGILLGLLTDGYTFLWFTKWNEKMAIAKALHEIKYQYECEKVRYEELCKLEEDVAKLRHDFGNYMLILRNSVMNEMREG